MRMICAWCGDETQPPTSANPLAISHGVCLPCCEKFDLFPSEAISSLGKSDVNLLPFGVIVLDREGIVLQYNAAEATLSGYDAETVIGQNFWLEVAPCTKVQEFAGRAEALQSKGIDAREAFEFVFKFKDGAIMVEIVCLYDSRSQETTLLVATMS